MMKKNNKKSDPVKVEANCEYYCNGQNKAIHEVWYKPICDSCFRMLVTKTAEEIHKEVNKIE